MLRWSMDCYFDQVDVDITRIRVLPEDPSATQPPDATDAPSDNASSLNRCSRTSSAMLSTIPHRHRIPPSPPSAANAANSSISAYTSSLPLHEHSHQRRLFASLANDTQLPIVVHYGASGSHVNTRPSAKIRCLEIRWQLQARPRSIFSPATNNDDERPRKHVEGVFIYTFDAQGFIAEHKIQRIEPSPSRRILLMHSYGSKIRAFLESLKRRTEPELRPGLG
ncbi:hypothetical protein BC940DRAFT_323317 [Gongronella butleri]|nr:hypothetical protein BC940DRAFT_323317 [Gongronella butleri]